MLSTNSDTEPRFQIKDGPGTQLVFGIDAENWEEEKQIIGNAAFGYPIQSLSDVPAGEYYVQALFHKYETFKRSDGYTVKMPMDRGEGQQWDIWEAVYSPVGKDGYPKRLWDKYTGEINREVANYWKENYDLAYILKRDWSTLGSKLEGKIHIYCGDMDNYYLNNAVYLMEDILEETTKPHYDGEVDYGDRAEHCWNGDHSQPNAISRLRYHQMFITKWAEEIKTRAPKGADLDSWRY